MQKQKDNAEQQAQQSKDSRNEVSGKQKFKSYLPIVGATLLVIIISMIVFFLIFRYKGTGNGFKAFLDALQAVIIGFVIAYLINPIMKFFDRRFRARVLQKCGELTYRQKRRIRAASVALAMIIFLGIIVALIALILPQIVNGITEFVENFGQNMTAAQSWLDTLSENNPDLGAKVQKMVDQVVDYIRGWLKDQMTLNANRIKQITDSVIAIIRTAFNTLMGLIVAIYILMKKEVFKAQVKKFVYAVFRARWGNYVMEVLRKTDDVFGGFYIGDILDSLIIGIICFFGMVIMRMPYAGLIGLFVGVTNLIPIFGPYFGAIPSAILILMVDPWKALYFLIFIIVLQQFDGNILKPKVLGDTLGLSPFWIIFAVVLFGGLFGLKGFLLGVPTFAVIYYVIKRLVEHWLRKNKLPEDTRTYAKLEKIDAETHEVVDHD